MADMTDIFSATMIAEGVEEVETQEEYLDAWETLLRTGVLEALARSQGFWGRQGSYLIEEGLIGDGSEARARAEEV
jgi:hypothetical protein